MFIWIFSYNRWRYTSSFSAVYIWYIKIVLDDIFNQCFVKMIFNFVNQQVKPFLQGSNYQGIEKTAARRSSFVRPHFSRCSPSTGTPIHHGTAVRKRPDGLGAQPGASECRGNRDLSL